MTKFTEPHMTNQQHPITPPPELINQWLGEFFGCTVNGGISDSDRYLATKAARWGADQELDECCAWLPDLPPWSADNLRRHRRPNPPSLKAQAYAALDTYIYGEPDPKDKERTYNTIRKALETLPK